MQLAHSFTVPVPPEVAWAALLDPARVAPCFPGATLTGVAGDEFTGTVKLRLGPVALLYKGKGRFAEIDAEASRVVLQASGKDSRGNGTAAASVTATLRQEGDGTAVTVVTDLTITGRPAQLGRGMIAEVGGKIVTAFAGCLAERLGEPQTPAEPAESTEPVGPAGQAGPADSTESPDEVSPGEPAGAQAKDEINLIEVAGAPALKRLVPALLAGLVVLLVLRRLFRRRT